MEKEQYKYVSFWIFLCRIHISFNVVYADEVRHSRKSLKAFSKKAEGSGKLNLAVSGAVGVGMGIFEIGIPDIPVFTGMVLKSIYEIALNYGFSYETVEERRFILLVIEGAVSCGQEMLDIDGKIERFIVKNRLPVCKRFLMQKKQQGK